MKRVLFKFLFLTALVHLLNYAAVAQETGNKVTGRILENDSMGLAGASVQLMGSNVGTVTDFDGNFSIEADAGDVLKISYVGYQSQEVKVPQSLGVTVKMVANNLGEVVVTGYQVQKKADLTGAVSVVDVADLKKQATANPAQALQGMEPGVLVTSDGSPSGSGTSIRIRGVGTLNNNDPLYVIDGVPTQGGLYELNSNDIESMQVLKDASSASIYGSRAANGVIIITTKKGKKGRQEIAFNEYTALSWYTTKPEMLNADGFGRVMWQAYVNAGKDPNTNSLLYTYDWGVNSSGNPVLNKILLPEYLDAARTLKTSDTKWYDEISRKNGTVQSYDLSVTNGGDKGNYLFSLGYFKNKGIIKTTDFDRFSARFNGDAKLLNDRITVGENFTVNKTSEVLMDGGVPDLALQNLPIIPVHTADGLGWGGPVGSMNDRQNSVRLLEDNKQNKYSYMRVFGNAYLNAKIFDGLSFRTSFGVDYGNYYKKSLRKRYTSGYLQNDENKLTIEQSHNLSYTWTNTLNYVKDFGRSHVDAILGTEAFNNYVTGVWASREGFEIEDWDYLDMDAGTGTKDNGGVSASYALLSYFGKVNYSLDEKYLVSFTLRRDGSSRFGANNRYGTFPAFSLGWRLYNEHFVKDNLSFLSDLKLRYGYGITGNQAIDNNAIYSLYQTNYSGGDPTWTIPRGTAYDISGAKSGNLPSGYILTQSSNPNLKWEATKMSNFGADFGLFNQMLFGSVDYFIKNTSDILVKPPYLAVLGEGGGQWVNGASMKNTGIELALGYRNRIGQFQFEVNGNIASYRNKVVALPESVINNYGGNGTTDNILGRPLGSFYGYVADGLFTTEAQVENSATQVGKGLGRIRYSDLNEDGTIDANDQTWIGNPNPEYSYGFNISVTWKGFTLSAFLQGVGNVDVVNQRKYKTDFWSVSETGSNKGARLLDAWSPQNPDSDIPAVALTDDNNESRFSTYYVENGRYLKLRNARLNYSVAMDWMKKVKMSRLNVFVGGDNLLLLSKSKSFTGQDPENAAFSYPRPLVLTFGINAAF
ncbi:MAG: TonB-dependent receptor [Edaphocola sp.]